MKLVPVPCVNYTAVAVQGCNLQGQARGATVQLHRPTAVKIKPLHVRDNRHQVE